VAVEQRIQRVGATTVVSCALFFGGWAEGLPRIERDLRNKAVDAATALNIGGVRADMSGQDATLRCDSPLSTSERDSLTALVGDIRGIRVVRFADSCLSRSGQPSGGDDDVDDTLNTSEPTDTDVDTTSPDESDGGPGSTVGPTLSPPDTTGPAPTTSALVTSSTTVAETARLEAAYEAGLLMLSGEVSTPEQRAALITAAGEAVTPANVVDQLVVVPGGQLAMPVVDGLVLLISSLPRNLATGAVGWDGVALYGRGQYRSETNKAAFESVAAEVSATTQLSARPDGAACAVEEVAALLNSIVAEQPIQFDGEQSTIRAESSATLDRVASVADSCTGVVISVVGHTSSDGDPATNVNLSVARANAVLTALTERGVPEAQLLAVGFGARFPILDGSGEEDRERSRRVEFAVAVG
jgi:OmpA-OmpF porin, OOP family